MTPRKKAPADALLSAAARQRGVTLDDVEVGMRGTLHQVSVALVPNGERRPYRVQGEMTYAPVTVIAVERKKRSGEIVMVTVRYEDGTSFAGGQPRERDFTRRKSGYFVARYERARIWGYIRLGEWPVPSDSDVRDA